MELDDEHTKCGICVTEFSFDRDNKDPEIRKHLPVLSSSQRCDHWFCHGCILREQLRVAEENNGRIPKWLKCMHCREKTSFNPAEPKYHRLLIDLLARAQAARVKSEEQETKVAAPFITDVSETTISAGIKRKTPPETAETASEKSKSKSSKETEEGMCKSDDDDDAKKRAAKQGRGRAEAAAGPTRKSLPISATAGLKSPPEKALKGKKNSWRKRRKKDLAMIIGDEIPDDLSSQHINELLGECLLYESIFIWQAKATKRYRKACPSGSSTLFEDMLHDLWNNHKRIVRVLLELPKLKGLRHYDEVLQIGDVTNRVLRTAKFYVLHQFHTIRKFESTADIAAYFDKNITTWHIPKREIERPIITTFCKCFHFVPNEDDDCS